MIRSPDTALDYTGWHKAKHRSLTMIRVREAGSNSERIWRYCTAGFEGSHEPTSAGGLGQLK